MEKRSSLRIMKSVIFALVLREVRGRFGAKRMGAFWFVFEPLAHVLLLTAIMTIVRQRTIPGMDAPVFLVAGIVPFLLFRNIALRGMEAVNANQGLFAYRQIKPFDCMLARAIVEFFLMACVYVVLIFGLGFWCGYGIGIDRPLEWFGLIGLGLLLGGSMGLIFAAIVDVLPEIRTFIRLLFLPLYLLSGVIVPPWRLPEQMLSWLTWNPLLHLVDLIRAAVFPHYPHTPQISLSYVIECVLVAWFISMAIYRGRHRRMVAL